MKKIITIILIIISILLLGFGLKVANGSDTVILRVFIFSPFLEIVGGIWAIYGIIVLFINSIINKYKKH